MPIFAREPGGEIMTVPADLWLQFVGMALREPWNGNGTALGFHVVPGQQLSAVEATRMGDAFGRAFDVEADLLPVSVAMQLELLIAFLHAGFDVIVRATFPGE